MEKVAVGLHGWANVERPEQRMWIPQMAQQLKLRGYEVCTPEIDAPDDFDITLWEKRVDELIIPPVQAGKKLFVYAHSNSCMFVLNSAAKLSGDAQIDLAMLFAPYLVLKEDDPQNRNVVRYYSSIRLHAFANTVDLKAAGAHIKKTVLLYCEGERDPYINIEENRKTLEGGLGSQVSVVRMKGVKHFILKRLPNLPELLDNYLDKV